MSEELDQLRELAAKQPYLEMLAGALDALADPVIIASVDGTIQFVNAMTELIFGYKKADLLGQKVEMLIPERYRGHHVGYREGFWKRPRVRSMGSGKAGSGDHTTLLVGLTKEGTEFPCYIMLVPYATQKERLSCVQIRVPEEEKRNGS
jgi:PAS domain S-box-containing protein